MRNLCLLLLLNVSVASAQIQLSDQAEISVLTLGPWQGQLYTAFGHSAFRVYDPVNEIDKAYNYGVFDYDRPNFYLNFARGYNVYMLGVSDYPRFEYAYIYYNRYIHEQVLNLTQRQKQRLYDFLVWNAAPENRDYLYDYFYDNCATKIPEVMLKVFGDTIVFNYDHIKTEYSFRELTDLYLGQQPWGDLGIDIGLGLPTDKKATPYEYMFLPDFVEAGFANAQIRRNNEQYEPLVKETNIIYESEPEPDASPLIHPLTAFTVFLLVTVIVSYRDQRRRKLSRAFDSVLYGVCGLVGLLLFLLWTATNHQASARNMNLLWALPTHLVIAIALWRNASWVRKYFLSVSALSLLLLLCWFFLPQKLHYGLIPFVAALGLRAWVNYRLR